MKQLNLMLEPVVRKKTHDIQVYIRKNRGFGERVKIDRDDMDVWSFDPNSGTGIAVLNGALVSFSGQPIREDGAAPHDPI